MVLIWTTISCGDLNYCGLLVVFNSLLQVVLFAPYAVFFCNVLGGSNGTAVLALNYTAASRAVAIVRHPSTVRVAANMLAVPRDTARGRAYDASCSALHREVVRIEEGPLVHRPHCTAGSPLYDHRALCQSGMPVALPRRAPILCPRRVSASSTT